jgi:hypothetical protein
MAMSGNFRLELRPRDDYLNLQALHAEEENMTHPVHGKDPEKKVHRTYKTLTPEGEIAVVQRPEGTLKIVLYTGTGEKQHEHTEILIDHRNAFDLAMEILQHAYRLGQGLG